MRHHPPAMRNPPPMPSPTGSPRPGARDALLINPFYAKDPHGSFGKHVLTPSLALTQVAAATPAGWDVRILDENLLQPPRLDGCPNVVGITVHLTFARRAYDLARHFRDLGAIVVLGGPHVTACPDEAADHADAIAIGDGVTAWPRILADVASGEPYLVLIDNNLGADPDYLRSLCAALEPCGRIWSAAV